MDALHHVGISVRDLDASIRFYHDLLGLELATEPSPWFDGEELGRGVGVPGASLRLVTLRGGGVLLELLEFRSPESETARPLRPHSLGASHVGFHVADIRATKAELEAKGVRFHSDVNVVDEGVLAGWRWVYFDDPDGYPLELVEVAYADEPARRAAIDEYLRARG